MNKTHDKKEYNDYINSPEWQEKREQCFNIFGKKCMVCDETRKLHVHHKTYQNFMHEDVETDLIPLCDKHHKSLHKFCDEKHYNLWKGSNIYLRLNKVGRKQQNRHKRNKKKKKKWRVFEKKVWTPTPPKVRKPVVVSESDKNKWLEILKDRERVKLLSPEEQHAEMLARIAKRKGARYRATATRKMCKAEKRARELLELDAQKHLSTPLSPNHYK